MKKELGSESLIQHKVQMDLSLFDVTMNLKHEN